MVTVKLVQPFWRQCGEIIKSPLKSTYSPDWCGSLGWLSCHKTKGCYFVPGQGTCLGG